MFRGHKRLKNIGFNREKLSVTETFRLIREICAGNSSMIGTVVTSLEMLRTDTAVIRQDHIVLRSMSEKEREHVQSLHDVVTDLNNRLCQIESILTTFLGAANDDTTPSGVPTD